MKKNTKFYSFNNLAISLCFFIIICILVYYLSVYTNFSLLLIFKCFPPFFIFIYFIRTLKLNLNFLLFFSYLESKIIKRNNLIKVFNIILLVLIFFLILYIGYIFDYELMSTAYAEEPPLNLEESLKKEEKEYNSEHNIFKAKVDDVRCTFHLHTLGVEVSRRTGEIFPIMAETVEESNDDTKMNQWATKTNKENSALRKYIDDVLIPRIHKMNNIDSELHSENNMNYSNQKYRDMIRQLDYYRGNWFLNIQENKGHVKYID